MSPENVAAKGVPYFIPEQNPPAGTAIVHEGAKVPRLFTPLTIRGITLPNRIWVSPMCQYSGKDGFVGPWHTVTYGELTKRGPGLTMLEATAVAENARITPEDLGIWKDAHVEGLRGLTDFAHSQGAKIAIQLAHAGRKASTVAPWLGLDMADEAVGGWPKRVVGPDGSPFYEQPGRRVDPHALTIPEIEQVRKDFAEAAKRAVRAGFDVIELHFAHGYLVSSFLSPASNGRMDAYGGSFENRVRLALEIAEAVRAVLPETMPLFARISGDDWMQDSVKDHWDVEQSAQLALLLAACGVDVIDVSSGGIHRDQHVASGPGYQVPLAKHIKKVVGDKMLVSTVGTITSATLAEKILVGTPGNADDAPLDLVAVGRSFQKSPGLVWHWADELQVDIQVPHQIRWGFTGRAKFLKTAETNLP